MRVKSESEVPQSCLTPSDPMYCSPPGFSVHDILQARGLEWIAIALSDDNHEDCGNVKMSVYGNSKTYETIYIVFK